MARVTYPPAVVNDARRAYVEENLTPREVEDRLRELHPDAERTPSASTVNRWRGQTDPEGKDWDAQRDEYRDRQYAANSPARLADDVRALIEDLRRDTSMDAVKKADALSKLTASLTKLTRPEHQLPAMYHVLEELVRFVKREAPEFFTKPFLLVVRAFKDHLRARVEGAR